MAPGRKPNLDRWNRIADLRQRGLSLAEIARTLGMRRQGVQDILRRMTQARTRVHPCCTCGRPIASAGVLPDGRGVALCLECLAQLPEAPFGQRLRAYRLASGLTRAELGRRAFLAGARIAEYEQGKRKPLRCTLTRLVDVLGDGILPPAESRDEPRDVP
jgi:transcriptional regulator with XRE-family HTH domain